MFDYIIIGGGMGGLSAGNFLAKYNKKVLLLEKHNIPGGLITSFKRKGAQFNLGIESLYELKEGQTIPQFLEFWGTTIAAQRNTGDICCFIDGKSYSFRHNSLREDFLAAFPEDKADVNRIFDINEKMYVEMNSGTGAPKPPYEMNLLELIKFGINNYIKRPALMKYGLKDASVVLDKLTKNPVLRSAIYSKGIFPMVYMAYAYRFKVVGKDYYPTGGMQAIPDASVKSFTANGGTIKLNAEVTEILFENGKAIGVKTKNGECYYAGGTISNASPHFTYHLLPDSLSQKSSMVEKLVAKKVFPPICALFMSVKSDYDFGNTSCFSILSSTNYKDNYKNFTPEDCPIEMIVYPPETSGANKAVVALLPIPYEYHNYWETGANRERGKEYYKLKSKVLDTVLARLTSNLGQDLRDNIVHSELSTPITFERYTYSKQGSFMGWAIDAKNYGKFMKQKTEVPGLYLCGQWVFPGFGVAGVLASGYYLAKDLLKGEGIDLEGDFKRYFDQEK
jgi:phytoene dehydrogenase-like protein